MVNSVNVLWNVNVNDKKQLFELIAMKAAELTGMSHHLICERLYERDKLFSSCVGNGVSIPQAELPFLKEPLCLLLTLKKPVNFKSFDREPITLACVFLAPEGRGSLNLRDLSRLTRTMTDKKTVNLILGANSPDAVAAILNQEEAEYKLAA